MILLQFYFYICFLRNSYIKEYTNSFDAGRGGDSSRRDRKLLLHKEEIIKINHFLSVYGNANKVELLPYHSLGENKYYALNMNYKKFTIPSKDQINSLKNALK